MLWFVLIVVVVIYISLHPESFVSFPEAKGALVIVEPRAHAHLAAVVDNFDKHTPSDYILVVFHGKSSRSFAEAATSRVKRQKLLIALEVDNLNATEYNSLLKTAAFWNQIPGENILLFQTDAALCGRSSHILTEFESYPYIGCSYDNVSIGKQSHWNPWAFYGVGGLSFRKKSFMLQCIQRGDPYNLPEDVFFSECVSGHPEAPQSAEVLSRFCTQSSFNDKSFGAHKLSLPTEQKGAFIQHCPEASFM